MKRKQSTQQSYVISVSLGKGCYRHIRICANDTLKMLSDAILAAFSFDNDHQHAFFMDNKLWSHGRAFFVEKDGPWEQTTYSVHLCQLGLPIGAKFKYLFDFGDEWPFQCRVLKLIDEPTNEATVIRSIGEAPEQYKEYDDCFEAICEEDDVTTLSFH
ncbi:MAG: hypothetical protein RR696_13340 [Clostridia bacterium]